MQHPELGRFFSEFDGHRYVPLPFMRRIFPQSAPDPEPEEQQHRPRRWPLPRAPTSWRGTWPKTLPYDVEFEEVDLEEETDAQHAEALMMVHRMGLD